MPRITTYGISVEEVKRVSRPMIDALAALTRVPREHFSIQVCRDVFIFDGAEKEPDPFVEVALFDRGETVEDAFAKIVTEHLQALGYPTIEVCLIRLERRRYYENGQHF